MNRRILVAGIGNIFCGDDGFGVEVARRLAERPQADGVRVVDFGIRGMDLAFALLDDYDAIIFVDAAPRGGPPGMLTLLEPEAGQEGEASLDTHGMDPVKVLAMARMLGAKPTRILVVACEPERWIDRTDSEDVLVELSTPVRAAIEEAVTLVESLIAEIDL